MEKDLRGAGYSIRALEDMEPHVREWDRWMRAVGEFYDYRDTDGFGRVYQVHRRPIMPAMRVCQEWGSLLLDERTVVACESAPSSRGASRAAPFSTSCRCTWVGDDGAYRIRTVCFDVLMAI